jgi:hypothetical protein
MKNLYLISLGLFLLFGCVHKTDHPKTENVNAEQPQAKLKVEKEKTLMAIHCIRSVNTEAIAFLRTALDQNRLQSEFPHHQLLSRLNQCESTSNSRLESYKQGTKHLLYMESTFIGMLFAGQKYNDNYPSSNFDKKFNQDLAKRISYWEANDTPGVQLLSNVK